MATQEVREPWGRREHYLKVGEDGTTKVVHRVAIFDTHGSITSVISQLDVMRCAPGHDRRMRHCAGPCQARCKGCQVDWSYLVGWCTASYF